ncbi:glycosyltransferase family 2 protein [Blautia obeum]|uniref:Glycosyltransferase family 2 protein n=1 Tax=Blautia obeum TaxID=40520 RepID=A0A414W024_9FIRM|nr:glycosyltransferase family 2 protein [Blautia obeum]RHH17420.1 glycosyltransferase family 2 protein [Blautia obeum]
MKAPKLSVLIAAYNAEQYLDECIQSVLNQKYSDYEIIIIDDGSTDSTYDICKKYASQSKKIKVHSWENHGLILARRKAIDLASGEYVLFLDADDAYKANAFEEIVKDIQDNADVIIYRFEFFYENGTRKESKKFRYTEYLPNDKNRLFRDFILNYEYNHMWSKVMRREILLSDTYNYNIFKSIKLGEDLLQSIQVYGNSERVLTSDKVIYSYRVLKNSMSHGFNRKHIEDITKVYSCLEEYLRYAKWNVGEECYNALTEAFSVKIASLLRELWMSDVSFGEKKCISKDITMTNSSIVDPNKMIRQNRILWKFAKKRCWGKCAIYIGVLEKINTVWKLIYR